MNETTSTNPQIAELESQINILKLEKRILELEKQIAQSPFKNTNVFVGAGGSGGTCGTATTLEIKPQTLSGATNSTTL